MDADLVWIQEETERGPIEEIKANLASAFEGLPADLCDDLQICRFLRGHRNSAAEAATYMEKAIVYRRDLISREPFKSMRTAILSATILDLKVLPGFARVSLVFPIRDMEGYGESGLPVMLAAPRLLDFDAFKALTQTNEGEQAFDDFLRALLELRSIVLHNLSHAQHRMVKYVDLRDLTDTAIASVISSGIAGKLKGLLGVLQDYYPESVHQIIVHSAPPAFSSLFAVVSSILNSRMKAKLKVFARGTPFAEFSTLFDARAIWSWVSQVSAQIDFKNLTIANGSQEVTARWLEKDISCKWSLTLEDGADVVIRHSFIPATGAGDLTDASSGEMLVTAGSPHLGGLTAKCPGVLWLCIDNYSSWWHTKIVTLTVE